jgi:integrase
MSSDAWTFQRPEQVKKMGEDKAPWYCGWYEPDGRRRKKSFGPGVRGKDHAERYRRRVEDELALGTYAAHAKKPWADFVKEYDTRVVAGLAPRSRPQVLTSLRHFERIVKPVRVSALATEHIDKFIEVRRTEPGDKRGSVVSPATVNHDLRHVKAALRVAVEWGYLTRMPKVRMERVPAKLPRYVTGEHFAAIYAACATARMPEGLPNVEPADWWRALIVMGYMTGWRIGDLTGLRRDDLDLDAGTAVTRFEDNKGKRDERVKLHPVVVEHLRKIVTFDSHVFPWNHDPRTLSSHFHKIQLAAKVTGPDGTERGIHLPCRGKHEHTPACHLYGFHELRRAFATMNADKLTPDALQALMRHKSYQTTQVYISMARQMDAAVASLHVPEVLRRKGKEA